MESGIYICTCTITRMETYIESGMYPLILFGMGTMVKNETRN